MLSKMRAMDNFSDLEFYEDEVRMIESEAHFRLLLAPLSDALVNERVVGMAGQLDKAEIKVSALHDYLEEVKNHRFLKEYKPAR